MATGVADLVLIAILTIGVGFLSFGFVGVVQYSRLRRGDRTDGGPLTPGPLTVRGTATPTAPPETVHSPATGERAVLYEYAVQRRGGTSPTPDWRTVTAGQNGVPFLLETAGGAALVDPRGAGLELPVTEEVSFRADPDELDAADPPIDAIAVDREAGTVVVGDVPLTNGEQYRFVERRIDDGQALTVAGPAADSAGEGPGAGDRYTVAFRTDRGWFGDLLGVPYVIGDAEGGAGRRVRNRVIAGLLFGLPLVMLSGTYLAAP